MSAQRAERAAAIRASVERDTAHADTVLRVMRNDDAHTWPERLTDDLRDAPLVTESSLDADALLSTGELDTIRYVSVGLTAEQAAALLWLSTDAVKDRLKVIRYKLRAKNTTHAACEAIRLGLIR